MWNDLIDMHWKGVHENEIIQIRIDIEPAVMQCQNPCHSWMHIITALILTWEPAHNQVDLVSDVSH